MDLLDTVSHLYENEKLSEGRDASILQSFPVGYGCKEFGQQAECRGEHSALEVYRCADDISLDGCNDSSVDVAAMIQHLDGVFRQRINTEVENFRVSVNEIISDQQHNYRTMFGLQSDITPSQEVPMNMYSRSSSADNIASDYQVVVENRKQNEEMFMIESPASTFNSYGASEGEQGYSSFGPSDVQKTRDTENTLADKYLIRLMTATLLIGNTLRRKEYKVV